jgi:peptidyl-prolyl cis-trans isomerase B (cyclophilin B)
MSKPSKIWALGLVCVGLMAMPPSGLHGQVAGDTARRPDRKLSADEIGDLAGLLRLEDTRQFDETELRRILASANPEVRRRAVVSIGRIVSPKGSALLDIARQDRSVEVVQASAFAAGQLKDQRAVPWLDEMLNGAATPAAVRREAAQALGKILGAPARSALARYLDAATSSGATDPVIGEALLSLGRFPAGEDLAPIVRWATSKNDEIRWRVAWALFRPRDPKAVAPLLKLTADDSPEVRFWAVRGLAPAAVDQAGLDRKDITARLAAATKDKDRRVRTEALRALMQFDDDTAFAALVAGLTSPDPWISISAAESANRFASRADDLAPKLGAAFKTTKSAWLRQISAQGLGRLGAAGKTQLDELNADPAMKALLPAPAAGRGGGGGGTGGGGGAQRPAPVVRTDADYRVLVEKWIVPAIAGRPNPHAIWDTPRGQIELELYPGDAPLGMEYFLKAIESGDIVGTEFTRVVPNFVAQQQGIRNAPTLRDEVNQHGLLRATLAWASAGLDTGRPGYTLGSTPQPHNEGNFTALGHVVKGMDVVDALEQGDKILAARMK